MIQCNMVTSSQRRIVFFSNNGAKHSTASIFESLKVVLCQNSDTIAHAFYSSPSNSRRIFKTIRYLAISLRNAYYSHKHDVVICHTMAVRNLPIFALKRVMGYRLGLIIWDLYPESFQWHDIQMHTFVSHIFRIAERACIRSADFIVVPSEDYLEVVKSITKKRIEIVPIWHDNSELLPFCQRREFHDRAIELGFGGQINEVRGFLQAIITLAKSARHQQLVIHIFTSDENSVLRTEIPKNVSLRWRGFLPSNEYKAAISALDAGIVSLNPEFNLPAYPSKTIEYVKSGLPVLYVGPDLPGYIRLLTRNGIGAHIQSQNDLALVLRGLHDSYSQKRQAFLEEVSEQQKNIYNILDA